jgi:hypothetical protein
MLNPFTTWQRSPSRQHRALLRSLARWQSTPNRELGEFGLCVTTEITTPDHDTVAVRFTLHHERGGVMDSGQFNFSQDHLLRCGTLGAWAPLLREFLLPSTLSDDASATVQLPVALEGGLHA